MTRSMRGYVVHGVAALAVVLAVGALGVRDAKAAQIKRVAEKTFEFAPGGEVAIESSNGRIVIEAWDRAQARIQVTRSVRAPDDKQAEELLRGMKADVEVRPDRIEIVSRYPKRRESSGFWDFLGRKVASMDIHYYIQIPRQTTLDLKTSNGEIRIRGVTLSIEAGTTNGDIEIAGGGPIDASTTNGSIELVDVSGNVEGSTTNGNVRADLNRLAASDAVALESTNGNVTLTLPGDVKAKLEASTTNGKVTTSFPITVNGVMSSKSIEGTIGGGGAAIGLSTTNGSIRILKRGDRERP
jgi:hypothetical protein